MEISPQSDRCHRVAHVEAHAARWQEKANERLRLAKEAGELEREHRQVSQSVLDLTHDLAATPREQTQLNTRTPTPTPREGEGRVAGVA
jgi:hypothetical protein